MANCPSQLNTTLTAKNDQFSEENARQKQQVGANQLRFSELEEESSAQRSIPIPRFRDDMQAPNDSGDQHGLLRESPRSCQEGALRTQSDARCQQASRKPPRFLWVVREARKSRSPEHHPRVRLLPERRFESPSMISNPTLERRSHKDFRIAVWVYEIGEGMRYVHGCRIVHPDIKPSNQRLWDREAADDGRAEHDAWHRHAKVHGAGDPEGGVRREGRRLLVRRQPVPHAERWRERTRDFNVVHIGCWKKAEIPSSFSPLAKDLINACWSYDPKDSPSFDEILEKNNCRLFELNDGEVFEVEQFVKQHKGKIPDY